MPPLLAIVLDRLNNRADLKSVIAERREETANVRAELLELNDLVTSSQSQPEIEAKIRHIDQSFDAIVPESRLSDTQRWRRRAVTVQRLARPLIRFMAAFIANTGVPYDEINRYAGNVEALVLESNAIVDRTVTAKTYSSLIKTNAIQSLVKHHFTKAEIAAIEKSLSVRLS